MSIKEQVTQELDSLSEAELKEIAEYVTFLKFRARVKARPALAETQLAALYAEFADEDRKLAEEGMSDYAKGLIKEDA
ncbi:hypothetical protein HKBW3S09_01882 [Candidatus Hakubella thermalkaliphila]|uniref:DUF2281 domain-containing protein n=1 Tax=Candidatus Hakubella thermalkaliphila TaxID=2754717 RepID=A0A6V8Q9I1_9ACTN|nr:hypothetical protein [Candidatus Hakubella thermalkaliphila]GFP24415.1 hypothetical protein HKBW3S09_01882 [Candidatus Hakubella thermalkaliphila]GFP30141.1 hypothetical protein HKBW3S34_01061 [Candidatus Hakubella thermalkaliphila]GFP40062.1 hypothetical protein HKBW3S47_01759 [Candidatus Hakubella thermalkaliphila]GFP41429.1 hypothetical protein HKBW3C_00554 [Candidatus Hakubella thermalkaliphila]